MLSLTAALVCKHPQETAPCVLGMLVGVGIHSEAVLLPVQQSLCLHLVNSANEECVLKMHL